MNWGKVMSCLDNSQIGEIYSKGFYASFEIKDVTNRISLDGESLEVVLNSDDESEVKEDLEDKDLILETLEESNAAAKVAHKRSTKSKRKKQSTTLFSPVANARKSVSAAPTTFDPKPVFELIESVDKRVGKLEDIATKMDKAVAQVDLEINVLSKELSTAQNDLSESLISRLKHEFSVMKESQERSRGEIEERLCKAESEVKRWQGRVGSLVEEKGQMSKRIKLLEDANEKLQCQVSSLISSKESIEESQVEMEPPNEPECRQPEVRETVDFVPEVNCSQLQLQPRDGLGSNSSINRENGTTAAREEFDFVFLCDSNRRFINVNELCPKGRSKVIICGTTDKAVEILASPRFDVRSGIILNTGVNDLEHLPVQEIVQKQVNMVNQAVQAFPDKKIIMSSITPRCDDLDQSVFAVNKEVGQRIQEIPNVILVDNGNLRNRRNFYDAKHFNKIYGVRVLAGNIKAGIRRALGISVRSRQDRRFGSRPQPVFHAPVHPSFDTVRIRSQPAVRLCGASSQPSSVTDTPEQSCFPSGDPAMFEVQHQIANIANMVKQLVASRQQAFYPSVPPGLAVCSPQFGLPPQQARVAV